MLLGVVLAFPRRYELGPPWEETIFIITLLVVVLISVTSNLVKAPGRVSNAAILAVVGLMSAYNALALFALVVLLLFPDANRTEIEGPRLLASGVSIWLTNVLTFALLYWEVDGGGPERRGVKEAERIQPHRYAALNHPRAHDDDGGIGRFVDGAGDRRRAGNQYHALVVSDLAFTG